VDRKAVSAVTYVMRSAISRQIPVASLPVAESERCSFTVLLGGAFGIQPVRSNGTYTGAARAYQFP
jgi:hypothetical protein